MWQNGVRTEVEEALREVKRLRLVALGAGGVLIVLAAYIAVVTYMTPGLPFVGLPLVALALFAVLGAFSLYVGVLIPGHVRSLWEAGKYADSEKALRGILGFACLGGVAPGLFVLRTIREISPLADATSPVAHVPTRLCPSCSAPLDPHDRFCRVCGTRPPSPTSG